MGDLERRWKVGELARATGLTSRALHHYDDIGLLVPGRTDSGHRVYAPADVERLYRVLALRGVGIALDEIGAALDDDGASLVDAVRRHVAAVERDIAHRQRLLDRLREMLDGLEHETAPSVDNLIGAVEAMAVVEATIDDIVTREPWEAVWEFGPPCVVLLRETGGERVLPIWIGEPEAAALVVHRRGTKLPRPMSPDLTVALLGAVHARVERVVIERLLDNTFFATVTVTNAGEPHEVDARPSDALNLALRSAAPIHVTSEVMDEAGLTAWPATSGKLAPDADQPPWVALTELGPMPSAPSYAVDARSPHMLRLAAAEARRLDHGVVGAPHLLLGLLADTDGSAAGLLARHGLTLAATRVAAAAMHGRAQHVPAYARRRGTTDVQPLHVLLALVDTPDARRIPGLQDVDLESLNTDVRAALDHT